MDVSTAVGWTDGEGEAVALLQGTAGSLSRRARIGRPRSPDPSSGPLLRSLLPVDPIPEQVIEADPESGQIEPTSGHTDPTTVSIDSSSSTDRTTGHTDRTTGSVDLAVDELTLAIDPDATSSLARGLRLATLDAGLARLSVAGPSPAEVLDVLVKQAAALLDAPARLAVATDHALVWAASCADPSTPIGAEVDVVQTACGAAWRTALIQHVWTPAVRLALVPEPGQDGEALSTRCCGSPAALLAVPLLRPGPIVAGRHADASREVIAVLALSADRSGWFDAADIEAAADLAEVAGERIEALTHAYQPDQPDAAPDQSDPATDQSDGAPDQPDAAPDQPDGTLAGRDERSLSAAVRVPRARGRQSSGGAALPAAMPAPDSMGLWQWDAVTGGCTWSSPVARLLGLDPEAELSLDLVREALVGADRGRFDVAVRAISTGRGVAGALRLKTPDGRAKHAYAWSEVRRDESGELVGAWGGVVDVTAFEHDATALRTGLAGLRAAQELTGLATWEWRPDAGELIWSEEMYRLVGVSAETFSPAPERWHAFIHPDDLPRARRLDLEADGQDGERVETFRLIGAGGEIRHVQSWSATGRAAGAAADARPTVYGATIDVTRQVHDRMLLEQVSATDPVTGLGNRLAFDRRMRELLTAAASGSPARAVTLILLDLDRFKAVNDSLGHQIGDRLLIEVARRLVAIIPEGSVTARMGGDEFVVVPPVGAREQDVRQLATGIVEALRAPYVLPETGELLVCPASLGVAMSSGRRMSSHDLLREADIALYRAKDSGRDRFVIFDQLLRARTQLRRSAERRLRAALEQEQLVMEYQPVVDFANGRIVGAQGLVRLPNAEEDDRPVGPGLFLDLAEQTGLVVEVDSWLIETAIKQLGRWNEQASAVEPRPWLAIKLSARSMENPRVIRRLIEAVKRGEVGRDRIKIELAERTFVDALAGVEVGLRQLIANGIGVGVDDFGTGFSALSQLQHFDLDFLKIDRSFVASVGEGQRADAVVTAIVDLAHAHGMRVIAEGVESGRQARRLREIGCDFAQGFHFGRPGEAVRIVRG